MTAQRAAAVDPASGVSVVDRPEDLSAFLQRDCAAAIWRRQPLGSFQSWINAVAPERLPHGRIVLQLDDVRGGVTALCEAAGTPQGDGCARLIEDVTDLSHMFADLMQTQHLRLRLEAVTGNACRKFHVDAITARLVCTYRGTGTQYGIGGQGADPKRVFTVPTQAPILLRGSLWPEHPASGLLHRSPPIEGTGETRLVLVLDPIFDPEDA